VNGPIPVKEHGSAWQDAFVETAFPSEVRALQRQKISRKLTGMASEGMAGIVA
jgi:hypothetical protein